VQAQFEIRHLVDLLACEPSTGSERGLAAGLGELVAGASATGLVVNLRVRGDPDQLAPATSATTYRVVQEGITNSLKHSPGAAIDIIVDCAEVVDIEVANQVGATIGSSLDLGGGGHGLTGMRDRVRAVGGDFHAGLGSDASWRLSVRLPAR
jgi:signal transduction histidine kinase